MAKTKEQKNKEIKAGEENLKKSEVAKAETGGHATSYLSQSGVRVYASLPTTVSSVSGAVESSDARQALIEGYLQRYNSPLFPHAKTLIEAADQNGLDYRLLTAIAQQESNLCKVIPPGGYNCWGWGTQKWAEKSPRSYGQ